MDNPNFHKSQYAQYAQYAQERKQEITDNARAAILHATLQTPSEQESKGDNAMPAKVPPTFVPFIPNEEWERKTNWTLTQRVFEGCWYILPFLK